MPDVPELTAPTIVTQEPTPTLRRRSSSPQLFLRPTPIARGLNLMLASMALGVVVMPTAAQAQSGGDQDGGAIVLRPGGMLQENLAPELRKQVPTFVFGEQIEGRNNGNTVIEGDAELRRHDQVIRADRIEHDQSSGDTKASGQVRIQRNGDRFSGPRLEMNVNTGEGFFEQPQYRLLQNEATGEASRIDFLDKDRMQVHEGTYTTCPRPPGGGAWKPDWLVRGQRIDLDQTEDVGTAYSGVLEFKDMPILAAPYLTFPLSDARKSGFLSPSVGLDSQNGFEVKAPYYFNLAPNYDLTLTPTFMGDRGLDVEGDLRYLERSYNGRLRLAAMPSDRLRDRDDRWFVSAQHNQGLAVPVGQMGVRLNINRVSDANYWRDFERVGDNYLSRLVPSSGEVRWQQGRWSVVAGAYSFQALQNEENRFTPPYDRLPQLLANYNLADLSMLGLRGWEFGFSSSLTRFKRSIWESSDSRIVDRGDRATGELNLTRRWQAPGWFVQPRARLRMASYQFEDVAGAKVNRSRAAPTLSLDNGLIFERDASFFGRDYLQTLEPRAFFTWTPFRDQTGLPNYDSGRFDQNFASMFFDDVYGGSDRVGDLKAVTLGVSSRLLDRNNGSEIVRLGLAQRYFFDDVRVTLPDQSALPKGWTDMLLAARVQWNRQWALDSTIQFNHETRESTRKTIGARYTPGDYKVLSMAYRVQRDVSEQLDIGWQWPLSDLFGKLPGQVPGKAYGPGQWYSVGRINYSIDERKPVEILAGFEYDAGCWLGRVVLQRQQTSSTTRNQKIMFQLEFNGLARIGTGSLQNLGNSIPRYKALRDGEIVPSRFENYD